MTNREMGVTTGPVELGAPTLTINPPAKPEEKASEAPPKDSTDDDVAADHHKGRL